jgi:hypothetical protein
MTCAWMHRIDLAEATGKPFNADDDHDGRIPAYLVAEWATTHGLPFVLELTGQAGGHCTTAPRASTSSSMPSSSPAPWPNAPPAKEFSPTRSRSDHNLRFRCRQPQPATIPSSTGPTVGCRTTVNALVPCTQFGRIERPSQRQTSQVFRCQAAVVLRCPQAVFSS